MIPVTKKVIEIMQLKISLSDRPEYVYYKKLAQNQLTFCRHHSDEISKKANKLYQMIIENKANHLLRKRCCRFDTLEKILDKYDAE